MPISSRYELMLIRSARRRGWTVEQEAAGPRYEAVDPGGMVRAWGIDSESDAWVEAGYLNEKDVENEQERDVFLYRTANPTEQFQNDLISIAFFVTGCAIVGGIGWLIYKGSQPASVPSPMNTPQSSLTPQQQADAADQVPPFVSGT